MGTELTTVFYGLAAAACWGAGDFSGGLATKRSSAYSVVIISQIIGAVLLIVLALLLNETFPKPESMVWGGLAGFSGGLGLIALYHGLATGRMGVVAPVTAVVTVIVPVLVSAFMEGLPGGLQLAGFALAVMAVWLVSRPEGNSVIHWRSLRLPVLAGIGFGLYMIFMDRAGETSILFPLVAVRFASISLLAGIAVIIRQPLKPQSSQLPIIALAGIFDTVGNAFFVLATQAGRLDVAAVASSLYPAGTVLLAWIILKEGVNRRQWVGVLAALAAIVLIAS